MSTFTVVSEEALVRAINSCKRRLVYIVPGLTRPIVHAMERMMLGDDPPALTIIVDTDPEVCRLGYGTLDGLKALQAMASIHHLAVRYQPGLRLGVLVCDDEIRIYSPTPLLIEAGATRDDNPNAIVLSCEGPMRSVLKACAAEGETHADVPLPMGAEIGALAASPDLLAETVKNLEQLPPKPYDIARIERVYNTNLQYVEFEVSGYKLASRRVQIPTDLLLGTDEKLQARLRNTFQLLEGSESMAVQIPDTDRETGEQLLDEMLKPQMVDYSDRKIEEERQQIYKDFLTTVPGHGHLIPKMRRAEFDQRIRWFETRVDFFTVAIQERLAKAVSDSINSLTEALLPAIMEHPPARLKKQALSRVLGKDDFRAATKAELEKTFRSAARLFAPSVKVHFKDLTYETIKDPEFHALLGKAFPNLAPQKIFEEHDAAPESGLRSCVKE